MKQQKLSATGLADVLGISERRVRALRAAGVLPGTAAEPYDLRDGVRAYCRHLRPASGRAAAGGADTLTLNEARISVLQEQAAKLRMENERTESHVVSVDQVAILVGADYARVRTRVLAIPTAVAAQVLRCRTPAEVQHLLEQEIFAALAELSDPEAIGQPPARKAVQSSPVADGEVSAI